MRESTHHVEILLGAAVVFLVYRRMVVVGAVLGAGDAAAAEIRAPQFVTVRTAVARRGVPRYRVIGSTMAAVTCTKNKIQ